LVLLESIVALAHGVGLKVVAEGIENQELADWLTSVGCDMGQGYLWEKAIPARALPGLRTRSGTNGINVALSQ
jgi:EAL domain-containing protein (putative c-di-GMP-specific phosphodiesterase class I)